MARTEAEPRPASLGNGRVPHSQRMLAGDDAVPRPLAVASAVVIRLVIVLGGVYLLGMVATKLLVFVIPFVVALLLTTLLSPPARALEAHGWHPAAAAVVTVGGSLIAFAGLLVLLVPPLVGQVGDLGGTVQEGIHDLGTRLPLGLTEAQLERTIDTAIRDLRGSGGQLARGVLNGALLLTQWLAAGVLAVMLTFFLVMDGPRIWSWLLTLLDSERRPAVNEMGCRAWSVLSAYMRGVVFVATVDAVLIGIAIVVLGVPLAFPLIVLTFVAAFFPIVGSLVAGAAAVLVALVSNGLATALILLGAIVLVQQLEGNVLYPVLVGKKLRLHPVAMLAALTVGGVAAGIAGAFLAVPVAAVIGAVLSYVRSAERHVATPRDMIVAPP